MNFRFKEEIPAVQRKQEAEKIRQKYPERIPVVVERVPKSPIADIDKRKFLVPNDITIAQFMWIIRKRIQLSPEKAIFLFVNKTIPLSSATMGEIYAEYKDEDSFLYIAYGGENTFEDMTSDKDSLTPLIEKICTVSTIGLFLTGVQICNRIYRMNSTGDISGFPFVATLVNCTLWLLYGYTANISTIIIVNFIGASLQMLYALTYLRYTPDRTAYLRLLGSAVLFLAVTSFYFQYIVPDREAAVFRAGLIASIATVIMFGSPLASLRDVIQKQSTESLSLPLCFANLIVPIEWVLYGILINDKFVQVPNFLGAILGLIQVSLFYKYPRQSGLVPKATNLGGI